MAATSNRPKRIRIVRDDSADDVAAGDVQVLLNVCDECIDLRSARREDDKAFRKPLRIEIVELAGGCAEKFRRP